MYIVKSYVKKTLDFDYIKCLDRRSPSTQKSYLMVYDVLNIYTNFYVILFNIT